MATPEENKEIVRGAYEGMAQGNPQAFLGALHPEVELHEPTPLPYGGSYSGHDEVIEFMKGAAAVVEGVELDHLTGDEDRVVALLRVRLRQGGEMMVSEHWLLRDGKAVELRVFCFDPPVDAT